jgi:uracil-DNA glycosylase family 4
MKLTELKQQIINCQQCKRLIAFRKKIITNKKKQFEKEQYWGKPTPGFGDIHAKIIIFGLAPAAHGATRTGRVFTGDKSGDLLYKALYKAGLSNQPHSSNIRDGLKLSCYITNVLKCVPPGDKPTIHELNNCSSFLERELALLTKATVLIAIGQVAFKEILKFYKKKYLLKNNYFIFKHGARYTLPDNKMLISSYHTSPRNVNTRIVNEQKMTHLFKIAKKISQ